MQPGPNIGRALLTALAAIALTACGGGSDAPACTGELTYVGGKFTTEAPFKGRGVGETEQIAIENTCWDYCFGADTEVDASYQVWFDKDKAKDPAEKFYDQDRRKGKGFAMTWDAGFKQGFMRCVAGCVNKVASKSDGFSATASCG